jgi:molecular chaperone DnaJ
MIKWLIIGLFANAIEAFLAPTSSARTHLVPTRDIDRFIASSTPYVVLNSRKQMKLMMSGATDAQEKYYKGQDAYQILGTTKNADQKEIKKAYRKAIANWHPDKFPDNEAKKIEGGERMEAINRAFYCIGDDDRKRRYDMYGEQGVGTSAASEEQLKAAGGPGMGGFGGFGGQQVDVGDISDIFDAFFGGQGGGGGGFGRAQQRNRNPNAPAAGDDLQVEVEVPFMTAVTGGQEKIRIRRLEECASCTGTGVKPGSKINTCGTCGGKGVVNNMQRTPFGVFNNVQTCPNCRGSGEQVEEYCTACRGKGSTSETKEVVIRVPAGVESGTSLRVRGAGNAGRRGGPRGDLFVQLRVKRDPRFRREGTEVYTEEEISYVGAILGTTIKAETVDGKVEVKIPAGTQPEQKLRLKGRGVPKLGSDQRGDQYITVKVKIPTEVSGKEKELVEKLAKELEGNSNQGGKGFFGI